MTADDQKTIIDEVTKAEAARCEAINTQNWEALDNLLADEYIYGHFSGRRDDKTTWLTNLKSFNGYQVERHSLTVYPYDDVAVTIGDYSSRRIASGSTEPSGQTKPIVQVWRKSSGQWRQVNHYSILSNFEPGTRQAKAQ